MVVAVAARLRYVFFWAVLGGAFPPPHRVLTARGMPRSAGVCKRAAARELAPCRTASGRKRLARHQLRKALATAAETEPRGSALALCSCRSPVVRGAGIALCPLAAQALLALQGPDAAKSRTSGRSTRRCVPQAHSDAFGGPAERVRCGTLPMSHFGQEQPRSYFFSFERSGAGGRRPLRTPQDGYGARTRLEPGLWGLQAQAKARRVVDVREGVGRATLPRVRTHRTQTIAEENLARRLVTTPNLQEATLEGSF